MYGCAVAFEPGAFEKDRRWFAPYYFKSKSGVAYEVLGIRICTTTLPWTGITLLKSSKSLWTEPVLR